MAAGMAGVAKSASVRRMITAVIGYAHDVIDLDGRSAAELAAVAVAREHSLSQ